MKTLLTIIICFCAWGANAGMVNLDLTPRTEPYGIPDVTRHCELKGYFIYDSTIFMCVKIRKGVSKKELAAYTREDADRQAKKRAAEIIWYNEYIKTDRGKAWLKEYQKKSQQTEDKD